MEYLLECKVRRLSQGMIENYDRHLRYLRQYLEGEYGIMRLEDVKPAHLKRFLLEKEDLGRKPQYINDLLKVFKTFFRYCVEEEYLKTSPAAKVKNVRQPKVLIRTFNKEEVLKMLNFHNGHDFISMRNKAMLALFFDTGMRLTEVMTMKDEQIRDGYVVVWGKGSKERVVPQHHHRGDRDHRFLRRGPGQPAGQRAEDRHGLRPLLSRRQRLQPHLLRPDRLCRERPEYQKLYGNLRAFGYYDGEHCMTIPGLIRPYMVFLDQKAFDKANIVIPESTELTAETLMELMTALTDPASGMFTLSGSYWLPDMLTASMTENAQANYGWNGETIDFSVYAELVDLAQELIADGHYT